MRSTVGKGTGWKYMRFLSHILICSLSFVSFFHTTIFFCFSHCYTLTAHRSEVRDFLVYTATNLSINETTHTHTNTQFSLFLHFIFLLAFFLCLLFISDHESTTAQVTTLKKGKKENEDKNEMKRIEMRRRRKKKGKKRVKDKG